MNNNHTPPKPLHFKPKALVLAVRRALPFLVAFSLGATVVGPAAARSGENAAAFTATQLIRQFTLKNTVAQVSQGMQGYVQEVNGFLRAPAMGVRPSGFPADMGSVPATVNLPRRDGAGRPLGYCAWDNASASSDANHLAGSGVPSPLAYAVISPGLNGAMETTCANVLATGTGQGDDFVQVTAPAQSSSKQFRSAVGTVAELLATPAEEGDVRLVAENNKLYSYLGGNWTPVDGSKFADDSVANGAGALAYTAGKVTVADFQAATATVTGALTADSGVFTNGVTAATFTGSGSGLTDLNAGNISSGVVGTAFGGTGVDGSAAAQGSLLIGTGAGFALGAITAGDGIGVLNGAGSITISNTGVLSITGTADQIMASGSNGDVVLSLPQGIATTSTPTFAGMMLNGALMAPSATFSGDLSARRLYLSDSTGGVTTPNLVIGLGAMAAATSGEGANTAVGIGALAANTTGEKNTAIGEGALNANLTGNLNTALGHSALRDSTTGSLNTALGSSALRFNISGSNNTAVGDGALYNNLTGDLNTAVGRASMISNIGGYNNTALGEAALYNNTSGYDNLAVGKHTLFGNTTGYENTALGVEALWHNTTGIGNVALGRHAGFYSETGSNNTFLGTSAIPLAADLNYATAIGAQAEVSTSNTIVLGRITDRTVIGATGDDGSGNLLQVTGNAGVSGDLVLTTSGAGGALGSKIRFGGEDEGTDPIFLGRTNNSADNSILQLTLGDNPSDGFGSNGDRFQIATTNGGVRHSFDSNGNAYHAGALTVGSLTAARLDVGTSAGVIHPNTIVGIGAMSGAQSGNGGNLAVGQQVLQNNTTGHYNTGLGIYALSANQTGARNTAVGYSALIANTTGSRNSVVGYRALYSNLTGDYNVAMGYYAMQFSTEGSYNVVLGNFGLGHNTTGSGNSVLGDSAMFNNSTGFQNVALGRNSMYGNTTGFDNVAVGHEALLSNITGSGNSAVGKSALWELDSGSENTAMGQFALYDLVTGSRNVALGTEAGSRDGTRYLASGSDNMFLGAYSGPSAGVNTLNFATAIGAYAEVSTNNTVVLGRTTDTTVIGATGDNGSGNKLQVSGSVGVSGTLFASRIGIGNYDGGVGDINLAIGYEALAAAQSGVGGNLAVGEHVLEYNSTGDTNTALGNYAMHYNETGSQNTAVGYDALQANLSGSSNTAVGWHSMYYNTTGSSNTAVGDDALAFNTIGNLNVAVGRYALYSNGSTGIGFENTAVGYDAMQRLTDGAENTSLGSFALNFLTTGSRNTVIGSEAASRDPAWYLTSGSDNTFLGAYSGPASGFNTLNFATAIGAYAEVSTSNTVVLGRTTDTTVIGATGAASSGVLLGKRLQVTGDVGISGVLGAARLDVGDATDVDFANTIVGIGAMEGAQSGYGANVAVGGLVLQNNTSGGGNTAIGDWAMRANTTGTDNVAVGEIALRQNTTGVRNTANGRSALFSNTTGFENVAVGMDSLFGNTTGAGNSAVGYQSLVNAESGSDNTAMGRFALDQLLTGSRNVGIGVETGSHFVLTSGSDNTFLGAYSGPASGFTTLNFATALGAYAAVSTNNTVVLGRTSDRVVIGATGTDGSGNKLQVTGSVKATAFNTSSDRRLKNGITQLDSSNLLAQLQQLNGYQYRFNSDPTGQIRYGVIAQEVATLFPHAVSYDSQGLMAVDYGALGAIAATAVGQLSTQVSAINQQVKTNTENITTLTDRLGTAEEKIDALESWRTQAEGRMDNLQTAIDKNIADIAKNAVAITANTQRIDTLEEVTALLDARTTEHGSLITVLQAQWSDTFSRADDGQTLVVNAPNLKASNFSAQQASVGTLYSERLMAEMAKIKALEVDSLLVNSAQARTVRAEEMNTGSAQVYAGVGLPALLFAATADGHYTVNTSALDGSYATATVIVNAGQAKIVPVASEGIELMAEGNTVKAIAAGKSIKASWIKMG